MKIKKVLIFLVLILSIISIQVFAEGINQKDEHEIGDQHLTTDESNNILEDDPSIDSEKQEEKTPSVSQDGKNKAINNKVSVQYSTHIQYMGWQDFKKEGEISGTSGKSLRLEAINIKLENNNLNGGIRYKTHVQNLGWQAWKNEGEISGTSGSSLRLEAIQIELTGDLASNYDIYYSVHVENIGWLGWAKNGEQSGSAGYGYRLEGIKIVLVKKGQSFDVGKKHYYEPAPMIYGKSHVQYVGWKDTGYNPEVIGAVGKGLRLEAFTLGIYHYSTKGSIKYSSYVENEGWQQEVEGNKISGTVGKDRKIEAIKISLTGEIANLYDVYYSTHVSNIGWLGWTKNGGVSGSRGYNYQIEGIKVKLVPKGQGFDVGSKKPYYELINAIHSNAHIENIGWSGNAINQEIIGTTNKGLRLEGIRLSINNPTASGGIEYSSHVQEIGWQAFKKDGDISGTIGKGYRIEAIKIRLTGDLANKYDIYYRAHIQNHGWLDWASNGGISGSVSCSYRMEAIQIKLVPKGSAAPGSTTRPYITSYWQTVGSNTYYYKEGVKVTGWQVIGNHKYYFIQYGELKVSNAKKIIDVSHHQKVIDWKKVKESGEIDGVIIRATYNAIGEDTQLKNNIEGVKKYGIPYGIYVANYAENYSEAVMTAKNVKQLMSKYSMNPTLGVYLDLEDFPELPALGLMNTAQWESITKGFVSIIPNIKIYANYNYVTTKLTTSYLKDRISWIARYNTFCGYSGHYDGWQYTSTGRVTGISGNIDISAFGDMAK